MENTQPAPLSGKVSFLLEDALLAVGLLFLGWDARFVVFGFWFAELLTYLFSILKIIIIFLSTGKKPYDLFFFLVGYGIFLLGHSIFLFVIIGFIEGAQYEFEYQSFLVLAAGWLFDHDLVADLDPSFLNHVLQIILGMLGSSLINLFTTFLYKRKYKTIEPEEVTQKAFQAILLPHFLIILGFGALMIFNVHMSLSIVIVALKFGLDLLMTKNPSPRRRTA